MEDENGNPGYSRSAKKTAKNDENAYILCGAEFGYTPEDIQTAYWMQMIEEAQYKDQTI